ncbi:hypothetical protein BAE44_0009719, partial [Dichanthelium oligosanthes]
LVGRKVVAPPPRQGSGQDSWILQHGNSLTQGLLALTRMLYLRMHWQF